MVARHIGAALVSLHVIPFAGLGANNSIQNDPDYPPHLLTNNVANGPDG